MPKFNCEVHEDVHVVIHIADVEADTPEQAAQIAHNAWVDDAAGKETMSESVNERWVEIAGRVFDTEDE